MLIAEKIVSIARSYIGQEEVLGNLGFKDAQFEEKMKEAGWEVGQAWCAYLGESVWRQGYGESHPLYKTISRLFSASALSTYYNFANSKQFKTGSVPYPGALVIWKHGTDPAKHTGHLGIVTSAADTTFLSVEGNTTGDDPNMREGYIVAEKKHNLFAPASPKGLNLVGFVYVNEQ